jgi:plastocyanin
MTMRIGIVCTFFSVLLALAFGIRAHAAPAGQKAAPKTYHVVIKGFKFQPEKLEVEVGDTVTWTNLSATVIYLRN